MEEPILLALRFDLRADELQGEISLAGPVERLGAEENSWLKRKRRIFLERAGAIP